MINPKIGLFGALLIRNDTVAKFSIRKQFSLSINQYLYLARFGFCTSYPIFRGIAHIPVGISNIPMYIPIPNIQLLYFTFFINLAFVSQHWRKHLWLFISKMKLWLHTHEGLHVFLYYIHVYSTTCQPNSAASCFHMRSRKNFHIK